MKGIFTFLIDGRLETYDDFRKIPKSFDHVITFQPEIPEPPHSEEQHKEIDSWNERLQSLMEKERARSN